MIIIHLLKPTTAYLNPGTGSILIQLISAAIGGGLFFLIKGQWKKWFKKNKKDETGTVDINKNGKAKSTTKIVLPPKCPNCKEKIDTHLVKWIDEHTARCSKCGELLETKLE